MKSSNYQLFMSWGLEYRLNNTFDTLEGRLKGKLCWIIWIMNPFCLNERPQQRLTNNGQSSTFRHGKLNYLNIKWNQGHPIEQMTEARNLITFLKVKRRQGSVEGKCWKVVGKCWRCWKGVGKVLESCRKLLESVGTHFNHFLIFKGKITVLFMNILIYVGKLLKRLLAWPWPDFKMVSNYGRHRSNEIMACWSRSMFMFQQLRSIHVDFFFY